MSMKFNYDFVKCCDNCNNWEFKEIEEKHILEEFVMYCSVQKSVVSSICKCDKWKNRV